MVLELTNLMRGTALLSIGIIMMRHDCTADEAAGEEHDEERGLILMENGVDGSHVDLLINTDINLLCSDYAASVVDDTVDLAAIDEGFHEMVAEDLDYAIQNDPKR